MPNPNPTNSTMKPAPIAPENRSLLIKSVKISENPMGTPNSQRRNRMCSPVYAKDRSNISTGLIKVITYSIRGIAWVVYASHESSITVCGDWLIQFFRKEWPGCEELSYRGPFSTEDLRGT